MEFTNALRKIYEDYAQTERIYNPFYVYCALSDLCHGSFEDIRMVKVYHAVNKGVNLFGELISRGVAKGLEYLKKRFEELENISFGDYKRCVIATALAVQPDFKFAKKPTKQKACAPTEKAAAAQSSAAVKPKKKPNKNKPRGESIDKARERLAGDFYNYFWNKYWATKAIHFIRRKRILKHGYDWLYKIKAAKSIADVNTIYQRGRSVINAI